MELSGIEILQAVVKGKLPSAPAVLALGAELISVEVGRATFALVRAEHHDNPIGSVHGGVYAHSLTRPPGCAVHAALPARVR